MDKTVAEMLWRFLFSNVLGEKKPPVVALEKEKGKANLGSEHRNSSELDPRWYLKSSSS